MRGYWMVEWQGKGQEGLNAMFSRRATALDYVNRMLSTMNLSGVVYETLDDGQLVVHVYGHPDCDIFITFYELDNMDWLP